MSWSAGPFAAAALQVLRASPGASPSSPALQVGDGDGSDLAAPYAVLYVSRSLDGESMVGTTERATVTLSVTSVGSTRAAADAVAGRVCAALIDVVLDVPEWSCGPIRHLSSPPTEKDPDTAEPRQLWQAVDQFRFTATRG